MTHRYNPEFGNIFDDISDAASDVAKGVAKGVTGAGEWVGGAVSDAGDWVEGAVDDIGDTLGDIPVLGGLLGAAWSGATTPFHIAKDIVHGVPLDEVALNTFEREIKNIKTVAPYAQTVISFVPGIGPVASGAIGAGIALANGQTIDEALLEGVKGALPGGPLAAAALEAGVGVIKGKPVEEIGISVISEMGEKVGVKLPPEAEKYLAAGLQVTKGVVEGRPVVTVLVQEAIEQLPPGQRDAARVAAQLGQGSKVADILIEQGNKEAEKGARELVQSGFGAEPKLLAIGKVKGPVSKAGKVAALMTAPKRSGLVQATAGKRVQKLVVSTKKADTRGLRNAINASIALGTGAYVQDQMLRAAAGQINNLERVGQYASSSDPLLSAARGVLAKPKLAAIGSVRIQKPKLLGIGRVHTAGGLAVPTDFADGNDFPYGDKRWQEQNGFAGEWGDFGKLDTNPIGKIKLASIGKVKGFNVGTAAAKKQLPKLHLTAVRRALAPDAQRGFDTALAMNAGSQCEIPEGLTPEEQAAFLATCGLPTVEDREGVVSEFLEDGKQGVRHGLAAHNKEKGLLEKILEFFGLA